MRLLKITYLTLAVIAVSLCGMGNPATAADVDVRLSTREAWVGTPVVLQLAISNATDYEQPTIPAIDGCDIRANGTPSQGSQTTIINGRRSQSRSVVMLYLITPRRAGEFEIPPFSFSVDGRSVTTEKQRFVATKSETGNLLFVAVKGGKDQVFVGQSLELTLQIWIKPFHDTEKNITLSEANMWQMISAQTSWGSFLERMQELAANNQRPGGQEVLRDDGQGTERSYYLYEITTTVYPKRSGKIDADDVQLVIDYPTALGKAPDPFAGFFADSGAGGSSGLSQLMGNDFFSSSFGNRLAVTSTRPITGDAKVDSTEVQPVPTTGRPADYRGAVGRYNIVTQATPTAVNAGDSITLNIGIEGTGPMELVQAPPLSELPFLTADFKVADQSLAGFVQDTTKLFSTTIRPRHEGITQIPAIPFSFFDPDTGHYETAMSDPISITVEKSESLSLDAIVGKQRSNAGSPPDVPLASRQIGPEFTNDSSVAALLPQSPTSFGAWWWFFVIAPPLVWLTTGLIRHRTIIWELLPRFRSPKSCCLAAFEHAQESADLVTALTQYIGSRTRQTCTTPAVAIGALRTSGMTQFAIEIEAFFQRCGQSHFNDAPLQSLIETRKEAREHLERIESLVSCMRKSQVRRPIRTATSQVSKPRKISRASQRFSLLLIASVVASAAGNLNAAAETQPVTNLKQGMPDRIEFSTSQRQTLLTEAGDLYTRGTAVEKTDAAEAMDLFTAAAQKYQLLVDSGLHNARLYRNLGNAYLHSNQLGRSIANYERATQLDADDRQLAVNLEFANSLVESGEPQSNNATSPTVEDALSLAMIMQKLRSCNMLLINFIGMRTIIWTLVITSVGFWSLQIMRVAGYRFSLWRFAFGPLLLLTMSLTSAVLASTQPPRIASGIIVADRATLRSGDGELFAPIFSLDSSQGHRVQILTTRGDWTQVITSDAHVGWLPTLEIEQLE